MKAAVLFAAACATVWAAASYLTTGADFKFGAVVAILLLGFVFYLDYRAQEHRGDERRRREIEATWTRRIGHCS